ncbi:MAG: hypothetical protein HQ572_05810 [Candidatus Omnitrophica bacterium]|nr:hypothetical protein [Candidatus Omnitrophota bacterium]
MKKDKAKQRRQMRRLMARMKGKRAAGFVLLLIATSLVFTSTVFAKDNVSEAARDFTKAGASIPQEIAETTNESNAINGVIVGTAKGVYNTIQHVGKGLFELLTFWDTSN